MCKTEKKEIMCNFLALRTLKKCNPCLLISRKKNVYHTSWELNLKKRVLLIKIISAGLPPDHSMPINSYVGKLRKNISTAFFNCRRIPTLLVKRNGIKNAIIRFRLMIWSGFILINPIPNWITVNLNTLHFLIENALQSTQSSLKWSLLWN